MKKTILAQVFLIFVFAVFSRAAMLMEPYLQAVTQDSIYVMVECDSLDPVTVYYGQTTSYGSSSSTLFSLPTEDKKTFVHRVKLTSLRPGSLYHYRASQNSVDWTGDYSFKTAPLEGAPFRFAWMADFRTGTDIHDRIAKLVKEARPDLSLYGGDLCMDGGEYEGFKKEFFRPAELELISRVPFFNAVGNHEGWGENTKAFLQAPDSDSGTQSYYSFDYADMYVLVLNNYDPAGYAKNSPQYKFAKKDLAKTKKKWKLVISHNPTYSTDFKHGDDPDMIKMSKKAFEPSGVQLALAGHAHIYQHNRAGKIDYFVIGSVGAPIYTPECGPYTVKTAGTYCYAIVDVDAKSLTLNSYDEKGELIENFVLHK